MLTRIRTKRLGRKQIILVLSLLAVILLVIVGVIFFGNRKSTDSPTPAATPRTTSSQPERTPDKQTSLSDTDANTSAKPQEEKGRVAQLPNTSITSITSRLDGSTFVIDVSLDNSVNGSTCQFRLNNVGGKSLEVSTNVSSNKCTARFQDDSLKRGSDWTLTFTYTDSADKLTSKKAISIQ